MLCSSHHPSTSSCAHKSTPARGRRASRRPPWLVPLPLSSPSFSSSSRSSPWTRRRANSPSRPPIPPMVSISRSFCGVWSCVMATRKLAASNSWISLSCSGGPARCVPAVATGGGGGGGESVHEARLVRILRNKRVYRLQLPQLVPNHGPVRRLLSFSHLMLMPTCTWDWDWCVGLESPDGAGMWLGTGISRRSRWLSSIWRSSSPCEFLNRWFMLYNCNCFRELDVRLKWFFKQWLMTTLSETCRCTTTNYFRICPSLLKKSRPRTKTFMQIWTCILMLTSSVLLPRGIY